MKCKRNVLFRRYLLTDPLFCLILNALPSMSKSIPRESGGVKVDNPTAPLRNGNAASKCLNDAAQKEKKNGPYLPLNDRPLQIRSGAA